MIDHRLNIDKVIATLSAVNILLCTINAGSTDKNMEHRLLYHSTAENANQLTQGQHSVYKSVLLFTIVEVILV